MLNLKYAMSIHSRYAMSWQIASNGAYFVDRSRNRIEITSAMNYDCFETITCNELPLLLRHRAVRTNTHAGHDINRQPTDSAVTGMQRITPAPTRSCAMNYRCCCVLVHAMNYSYCCAIVRSEKTHTLAKYAYASKRSRAMNYRGMQ